MSLNSLSTSDYAELPELLKNLESALPQHTSLSLPSLRIDSFEAYYASQAKKNSLTFAPEAGTQRLRDVINKDISEADIDAGATKAFELGYSAIKLYFMMGLPTETDEDVEGIAKIVETIKRIYSKNPKRLRALKINVSVSTFIPKPFTPFQWEAFATKEEIQHKISILKTKLYIKGVSFNWNDYELSEIEAILARGDRRLCSVLLHVYKNGAKFDSWSEFFKPELYENAFNELNVNKQDYTAKKDHATILPWDFVDVGVNKSFLLKEKSKAYNNECTGGCNGGCKGCGLQNRCNIK